MDVGHKEGGVKDDSWVKVTREVKLVFIIETIHSADIVPALKIMCSR